MKNKIFKSVIVFNLLCMVSCRSTDHENTLVKGGVTAVKFNLLGSDYQSVNRSNPQSQTHTTFVNPSTVMVAKLNAAIPTRSVAGESIGNGVQFRVIAYKSDDDTYYAHQDYIVGQFAQPMMLEGGQQYNIITYSYGSTSVLPAMSDDDKSKTLTNAIIQYDDNNRDLMYQKISGFIPSGNDVNYLDITLRHKLNKITTTITLNSTITAINNAILGPHYSDGTFSLSSGIMDGRQTVGNQNLTFSGLPATSAISDPVFLNADTKGSNEGSFSANLTIDGNVLPLSFPDSFRITPGYINQLSIDFSKCGAYTAPGVFREFMCQNLGATPGVNPFSPEAGNHGAKYQWGAKTGEDGYYISQDDDQANTGEIAGWNLEGKADGTWSDTSKTPEDPCDDGYRVPTRTEWLGVGENNDIVYEGTWANDNNYTSAMYIVSLSSGLRTLMLPASGYRNTDESSKLYYRGSHGYYWSSSSAGNPDDSYALLFDNVGAPYLAATYRVDGLAVRCIKQ
ncbi:hypothetical protein [Elizabethkingia ursingii]